MPEFGNYKPGSWGWNHGSAAAIEPFDFDGHAFPGGVALGTARYFHRALDILVSQPGFSLPTSRDLDAGMWGYDDRTIGGGSSWSFHAYGLALDVAAPWNPSGASPPAESAHRLPANTGDLVRDLGMEWGGSWSSEPDWMHLELHLTKSEVVAGVGLWATDPLPFPEKGTAFPLPANCYFGPYEGPAESISGSGRNDAQYRWALRLAQQVIGTPADGYYGPNTAAAVRAWQLPRGLEVDGLIGPATWRSFDV